MILMPQIFDITANENARYKRNELELQLPWLSKPRHGLQIFDTQVNLLVQISGGRFY